MTRKLSPYARKMRRSEAAQLFNGSALLNTIQRCKPYAEPIPEWTGLGNTSATDAQLLVRGALDDLLQHRAQPEDSSSFDLLAHAIDVSHIRAIQIKPDDTNPLHAPLLAAKASLRAVRQRRERVGRWGLAGPEREALTAAVDIYDQIITLSSPEQMHKAASIRLEALQAGKVWGTATPRSRYFRPQGPNTKG